MLDSQASTIAESRHLTPELDVQSVDLSRLPKVFVLPTHLSETELQAAEDELEVTGAPVASTIDEASIILSAVGSSKRAIFELRARKLDIVNIVAQSSRGGSQQTSLSSDKALGKRKREDEGTPSSATNAAQSLETLENFEDPFQANRSKIRIVKLGWLHESIKQNRALSLSPYLISVVSISGQTKQQELARVSESQPNTIPANASVREEPNVNENVLKSSFVSRIAERAHRKTGIWKAPALLRETTSEHDSHAHQELPEMPDWVKNGLGYACQRATPANSLNEEFIEMLKKIRLSRILIEDEIGVRAYSTSIASIAAYPYKLSSPKEILKLPGCDQKIALLFREYQTTGKISASEAVEKDPTLRVSSDFYRIWGVGAKTAREFYNRGWRDHDDIIEYGWNDLSRVQQIGLKYFDEFEQKIPRAEVEAIATTVTSHAKALTDDNLTCTIVGGYRRGKPESGDVDVVLSHPNEELTYYMIKHLVHRLEEANFVSHTLILSETNSSRGQQPLSLKMGEQRGGFDTLDKALLVWQDPNWPGRQQEGTGQDEAAKKLNPNPHRRVDIIISPWRTVGCAVAGWSSGTTFQRDMRRWARKKHAWKFDSSGVRDRVTGKWIDLEKWNDPATRAKTPLEAEKRVFEGLALPYLDPTARCTG